MKLIRSSEKEWQDKEGYSKKVFLDGEDLQFPGALVQMIKVKPGETAQMHHHEKQTEIFYFSEINGYWIINGEKVIPESGDIIVIEPNDKHTVVNDTDRDFLYTAFKLNYAGDDLFWD